MGVIRDGEAAIDLLFGFERPVEHIAGLFTCLLRNEIGSFQPAEKMNGIAKHTNGVVEASLSTRLDFASQAGSYALIRRERRRLDDRIGSFCREKIDNRYGIHFNAVDLADILPPDELAEALNAIIRAQSEAETHLHRAEAECQQRVLSAERGLAIAGTRSQAIEVEIRKLGAFFDVLDRNGVLGAYVARRRAEVMSESKTLFFKETA